MNRRQLLQRSAALGSWGTLSGLGVAALLPGCGGGGESTSADNAYRQANLAASSASYNALFTYPDMIDAWGVAIRRAGAGGHFWVTASAKSYEFIGDVNGTPLTVDPALGQVTLPVGANGDPGKGNGVVFNASGPGFVVTQTLPDGESFTAPAKSGTWRWRCATNAASKAHIRCPRATAITPPGSPARPCSTPARRASRASS